jgi:pimeloyl-ACP methyl ester carboxylesterase
MDLPAQRPQLGQHRRPWPRAWKTCGSTSSPSLTGEPARLHGLWLGGAPETTDTPVLLYLHGARYNVAGSAPRIQRMHELGFSVLAIDYRGFGKSSKGLPSEESAREDARAAWTWLAARHPKAAPLHLRPLAGRRHRHRPGGARERRERHHRGEHLHLHRRRGEQLQVGLAALRPFITQRFDAIDKVKDIGAPLLVVHGTADSLINPTLGRKLYDAATVPKLFVLVEGGSHHNTNSVGETQYRAALTQLFRMKPENMVASNAGMPRPTPKLAPPATGGLTPQDVSGKVHPTVPAAI